MQSFVGSTGTLRVTPRVRRLALLSVLALAAFFAIYLIAVHTSFGQRADDAALAGGREVPARAQEAADGLLRTVSIGALAIAITALTAIAVLRRRPSMLLLPAAIIGISVLCAEVLKVWLLDRPDLAIDTALIGNSYPSGHTTVLAAIGLTALVMVPPGLRGAVAPVAAAVAGLAGVFVVTAEWHRPSDPIGAFLLTLAVTSGLLALLYARRPDLVTAEMPAAGGPARSEPPAIARRTEAAAALGAVGVFGAAVVYALIRYGADVDWNRFHAAFLLASAAIVLAAGLTVGSLLRALGSDSAQAPPIRPEPDSDSVLATQPGRRPLPAPAPTEREI